MTRTDKIHMVFKCFHATILLTFFLFTACDDTENDKVYLGGEIDGGETQTSGKARVTSFKNHCAPQRPLPKGSGLSLY